MVELARTLPGKEDMHKNKQINIVKPQEPRVVDLTRKKSQKEKTSTRPKYVQKTNMDGNSELSDDDEIQEVDDDSDKFLSSAKTNNIANIMRNEKQQVFLIPLRYKGLD